MHAKHTHWTVSYRHRSGGTKVTSTSLSTPDATRQQYAFHSGLDWNTDVRITEQVIRETRRLICLSELPGPGQPTPVPQLPDGAHEVKRHYRFARNGPAVLPTGDDVRNHHEWLTNHRDVDPAELRAVEVTLTRYRREVALDELPDLAPPSRPEPGERTAYLAARLPVTRRNLESAAIAVGTIATEGWEPEEGYGYPGEGKHWKLKCLLECQGPGTVWVGVRFYSHLRRRRPLLRHEGCLPRKEHAERISALARNLSPVCPCPAVSHPTTPGDVDALITRLLDHDRRQDEQARYVVRSEVARLIEPCPAAPARATAIRALQEIRGRAPQN
ncbi:hypothetical protein OG533_39425 (plasmid) [Streptomyces sp. NBC_01186]|uniref:hypothetical protein n=1 Tax=unclassified Streptomyces TaxID=2593676 RepID=UPI002DDAF253|nr:MULTISPECIES: hypothetical protein [unclassified Streptomyces]WSB81982.1 hypothetical protein OHB04_40315 [Streptomyces sp. NBC_01775]WSS17957.1 hypothetical protein OG533_39425 [Streptomyces sp. NBC_01186]